jgi:MFS family permease
MRPGVVFRHAARVTRQPKVFYGWWIVASFLVTLFFGAGIGATHSVFFKPISGEFGWSRTALSAVLAVNALIGGLAAPFWGRMIDSWGGRAIVPVGATLVGFSLLFLGSLGSMWQAYALYSVLAIGGGGMSLIPISSVISHWFTARRGLAMGITLIGASLGGMIMAPLAGVIAESLGWRMGYRLYGLALWLFAVPLVLVVVRHRPQDMGLLPDGRSPEPEGTRFAADQSSPDPKPAGVSLREALRAPTFWFMALGFMLPMFAVRALFIHLVPMLTDLGISAQLAATAYGMIAGLSLIGRVGFGYAADRFSKRRTFALCYAVEAVGMLFLLGVDALGPAALVAFIVIFGASFGGGLALAPVLIGECFGLRSMGTIFGALGIVAMLGGAIGPVFAGWIFDTLGSYHVALFVFVGALFLAVAAISACRPVVATQSRP